MSKKWMHFVTLTLLLGLCVGTTHADLVVYYSFDNIVGDTVNDLSGSGNDGTLEDSPSVVEGQLGQALAFDNSRVVMPASDSLNADLFQGSFTVVAWINAKRTGNAWQQVFRAITAGATNDTMFLNNNGTLSWRGTVNGAWAGGMCETAADTIPADQWTHVAIVGDESNFRIYINGLLSQESAFQQTDGTNTTYYIGGTAGGESYNGAVDDFAIFTRALEESEIQSAMSGVGQKEFASKPNPENESSDIMPDTLLAWTAGEFAAEHDVYLGLGFDDVNNATTADAVYMGRQVETQYDPGILTFGETYFWRIDEVNAAPDSTVFKGATWSFEVEPVAYAVPIGAVAATATSTTEGQDPNSIVNGSGLNENDQHSNLQEDMWLGTDTDVTPSIQFELAQLQKLEKMQVWNHNTQTETILGFGIKEALIESSLDGENWTEVGTVVLGQATGMADYVGEEVALDGVVAMYIKITGLSNFSILGLPQKGLSEVRFYAMPMRARMESPAAGTLGLDPLVDLSWRAGRDSVQHEVLMGSDPNALTLVATVDEPSYTASVDLDSTTYWQINEVNTDMDPAVWEGDLWSFDTTAFVTVDDMESYDSEDGSWVWETWTDGFGDDNNGALLGHNGDDMETGIVYDGSQSLPYTYGQGGAGSSEAFREINRDWGQHGVVSLSLMFHGATTNTPGQMYIKVNDEEIATYPVSSDLTLPQWQAWTLDLPASALGDVETLAIGFEGGSGVVYIDAIRLYAKASETVSPVEPGTDNLVSYYALDGDFTDSVSNHDGTPMGTPTFVSDPVRGQVLSLDGFGSAADVAYTADLNPEAFTVSLWANPHPDGLGHRSPITSRDDGPQKGYIIYLEPGNTWQFWTGGPGWHNVQGSSAVLGEWTSLVATFAEGTKRFFVNGLLAGEGTTVLDQNVQQPLRIGGGASEGPGDFFFLGQLDDVRIYNSALTQAEALGLAERTDPIFKEF